MLGNKDDFPCGKVSLWYFYGRLSSFSAVLRDEVDDLVEVVHLGLVELLVAREDRNSALTVTHGDPTSVFGPAQAIEWRPLLRDSFPNYWHFSVSVDIPDVDKTFCVTRGKDCWVRRTPPCIINVLLRAFKSEHGLQPCVGAPKLDRPIHRS